MDEKKYPKVISDRKFDEWIDGCPLQIKSIAIVKKDETSPRVMTVTSCPCGDFAIKGYSAKITLLDEHREKLSVFTSDNMHSPISGEITLADEKAVYAVASILTVRYEHGGHEDTWNAEDGVQAKKLPEQEIFWQTDPLYEQIKRECSGVTDARYKPDEHDGYWRCTCGQINLSQSEKCGACHVSRDWLKEHLSEEYLSVHKQIDDQKSEKQIKREIRERRQGISDKAKAIIILASFVFVIVAIVATFKLIIPSAKYSSAEKALESGDFDTAISTFSELGSFRDSGSRLTDANYRKAQYLTGLDTVYMTTSTKEPWYSIDESGILSFKKDKYTGTWEDFIVPDVVDGVVVRELDRNFFLNCNELVKVTISDCVEVLGEQIFYNCKLLTTVNFGKNVETISDRAFINCTSLTSIEIPDTVKSLGLRAFNNCTALESVVLGTGITKIESYLFSYCSNLKKLTIKSPVTAIGEYAFTECTSLEKIYLHYSESEWENCVIEIGNEPLDNTQISFDN